LNEHDGVSATIHEGERSQFDVVADGETIFSKRQEGRYPLAGEIIELIAAGS
jgi:hypothetical protein